jgi:hypothetical protein
VDLAREKFYYEASLGGAILFDFARDAQGIGPKLLVSGEASPTTKELKLMLEVSKIAGLSCDGKEGN